MRCTLLLLSALLPSTVFPAGPASAADDDPLRIAICHGPGKKDLAEFARHLEEHYRVRCTLVSADKARKKGKDEDTFEPTPVTNLDAVKNADVILSNFYRTWAPAEQLESLQEAFKNKPVVGLRKAHHGFQNWLEADREVFGVDYKGHYFGKGVTMTIARDQRKHPLVEGHAPSLPGGGLYKHLEPEPDVTVLMVGGPADEEPLPQTWFRIVTSRDDQRVFYTRYDPKDLRKETVRDLVTRAVFWAANVRPRTPKTAR